MDDEKNKQVVAVSTAIEEKLDELDVPEHTKREVREIVIQSFSRSHKGPIPAPEAMAAYNQHIPNGADRIMKMAEAQSAHRQVQEARLVDSQVSVMKTQNTLQLRGQLIATIIALAFLGAAVYLGMNNHDWLAGVLGGSTVIGLVTVFVLGRRDESDEDEDEDDESGDAAKQSPSPPPPSSRRNVASQQRSTKRR